MESVEWNVNFAQREWKKKQIFHSKYDKSFKADFLLFVWRFSLPMHSGKTSVGFCFYSTGSFLLISHILDLCRCWREHTHRMLKEWTRGKNYVPDLLTCSVAYQIPPIELGLCGLLSPFNIFFRKVTLRTNDTQITNLIIRRFCLRSIAFFELRFRLCGD